MTEESGASQTPEQQTPDTPATPKTPATESLRVVVADDQQVVREGLVALLELAPGVSVVGAAADGEQTVRLVTETVPAVVLMDLRMPVLDGVEATRRVRAAHPEVAVVVLTTYADDTSIAQALRAGARGYLTKDAGRAEIVAALRAACVGQATFDATVSARMAEAFASSVGPEPAATESAPSAAYPDGLTAREGEVLVLIAQGLTNAEIAGTLFIGESTVKTHINNAFAKIGARTRADAVRYAFEHGLTGPPG